MDRIIGKRRLPLFFALLVASHDAAQGTSGEPYEEAGKSQNVTLRWRG
jgi:hypothetical protein